MMNFYKNLGIHRNAGYKGCFFSSSPSQSSSSIQWISPLQYPTTNRPKHDLPLETSTSLMEAPQKRKFISHETAINLIKREKDPWHALEVFNMASNQKGFNHNNATYATILHKLARSKKFQAVDAVLHQMVYETCKFNECLFLNLMKHFSKSSMHERVPEMFYAIQSICRERPSLKAISTCLNLLVEANRIDLARTFLLNVRKNLNLKPNTCIFNILVKHHCKNGALESAFELIKEMKNSKLSSPNLITYSTLMDGLCKTGRLQEAIDLFEEMVSRDQMLPDALTYNILINGFCRAGKTDRAKKIMEFMKKNGCHPNLINYSSLLNGFSKEGKVKDAREVFDEMKCVRLKPDAICYTTFINCLCRAGRIDEAMDALKEMKEKECKADTITMNVILGGLCQEGRLNDALGMLERLPYEGVYLNKASYRIVLNSLCRVGELAKAMDLLRLMLGRRFLPHFATSNELLVQLCDANKADDAAWILFGLAELGFKPEPDVWALLVQMICRERKLLPMFELLDKLVTGTCE